MTRKSRYGPFLGTAIFATALTLGTVGPPLAQAGTLGLDNAKQPSYIVGMVNGDAGTLGLGTVGPPITVVNSAGLDNNAENYGARHLGGNILNPQASIALAGPNGAYAIRVPIARTDVNTLLLNGLEAVNAQTRSSNISNQNGASGVVANFDRERAYSAPTASTDTFALPAEFVAVKTQAQAIYVELNKGVQSIGAGREVTGFGASAQALSSFVAIHLARADLVNGRPQG